jgi:VCBS repeat
VAQRLAAGETVTERFNATVTDSAGKSATQLLTVTVTGANDVPTITAQDLAGSVAEMGVPAGLLTTVSVTPTGRNGGPVLNGPQARLTAGTVRSAAAPASASR